MDKESEMIWDADVDVAEGLIVNNSGTSIKVEIGINRQSDGEWR